MPLFVRDNGWRHYYALSTEPKPDGTLFGIKRGSILEWTDTGERFIWAGRYDDAINPPIPGTVDLGWLPYVGREAADTLELEGQLEQLIALNSEILEALRAQHRGHEEYLWREPVEVHR